MSLSFRAYFFLVGLFAAWVGFWGYFVPAEVGRALPWTVPPLHARFVASMYLAGLAAMALAFFARQAASVRIPLVLAAVWTGALFVLSMLNLEAFDFSKPQVWFWMGAYAAYPLWGAWLLGRARTETRGSPADAGSRRGIDVPLAIVAVGCLAMAVLLAAAPALAVANWPWKVSPLLAQIYAGPFVAWGVAALLLAREGRRESRRIVLLAMVVFTALAIVATLLHRGLFNFEAVAAWVWIGGLAVWLLIASWRLVRKDRR